MPTPSTPPSNRLQPTRTPPSNGTPSMSFINKLQHFSSPSSHRLQAPGAPSSKRFKGVNLDQPHLSKKMIFNPSQPF